MRGIKLDFFVMTTSLLGMYALATQAAYTAANAFQNVFARYRRARGLPASTVAFSLVRGVGDTGEDRATVETFERNKTLMLDERQFLALLEPAFFGANTAAAATTTTGTATCADPLPPANLITCLDPAAMVAKTRDDDDNASASASTAPTPRWHAALSAQGNNGGSSTNNNTTNATLLLQQSLAAGIAAGPAALSTTVALVADAIAATVAAMLFVDREAVDAERSVADHGVDSLIAAELRSWFVEVLGEDVSMLRLLDQGTSMRALAEGVVNEGLKKAGAGKGEQGERGQ